MKKALMFVLIGIVLGSTATFATSKLFSDVDVNAWYGAAVENLANKDIIQGYEDGTFRPSDYVNRAELAVILDRFMQYNEMGFVFVPSELTAEDKTAYDKCLELNGKVDLAFNEEAAISQIACYFGEEKLCTQAELNGGTCFMETNEGFKSANESCAALGGDPYLAYTDLFGEDQIFCSFGNEGECNQKALNEGSCFKQ